MKKLLLFTGIMMLFLCVFAQNEVPRYAFIEVFTSSTCPPCAPANLNLKNILAQNDGQGGKYTLIKYQMNWPGTGDPYYTSEGNTRRSFYGANTVNAVPYLLMDASHKSSPNHSQLIAAQAIPSYVEVSGFFNVIGQNVSAKINVTPKIDIAGGSNLRLYVAIIEKRTIKNIKTNGETEFFHVLKKFLTDASGFILGDLTAEETITQCLTWEFKGNYRLPANAGSPINHNIEHSVEDFNNLEVVAWVQSRATKEVYNSFPAIKFTSPQTVNYAVINENGSLSATANGTTISSGAQFPFGQTVVFSAIPDENYVIKKWIINEEIVSGNTTNSLSVTVFDEEINVSVEFMKNERIINYSVVNGNGTLTAAFDGNPINSGDGAFVGKIVEFTAVPDENYAVKEWKRNGAIISGNTSNNYSITVSDNVTVTVEFKKVVGVSENVFAEIDLFPNPVTDELTINNAELIQKVTITNTLGQIVKEEHFTGNSSITVSTQNLQPGIFFVTLKSFEGKEITKKIVKK
jgi:hypothetical protein